MLTSLIESKLTNKQTIKERKISLTKIYLEQLYALRLYSGSKRTRKSQKALTLKKDEDKNDFILGENGKSLKLICVRLPKDMHHLIKTKALKKRISLQELIAKILEDYLKKCEQMD